MAFADRSVKVFAPASIGNVGSGFDVIGVALERPGDIVIASRTRAPGLHFELRNHSNDDFLPKEATKNAAGYVALVMLDELKPPFGVSLELHKQLPVGSGLGSSAASSVAAALAVSGLLTTPLKRRDLLQFALQGERLASGTGHADNVAPTLLGGAQLVRSYNPLDVIRLDVKNTFFWIVAHPHLRLQTSDARRVLPKKVQLSDAVQQWGNVGGLVAGLARGDARLVGRSVQDVIAEPERAPLICGFQHAKRAALNAGAFGCSISGSGPSLFAVSDSPELARKIGQQMKLAFKSEADVACDVIISKTNMHGASVTRIAGTAGK